jgi:transketolase
MGDTFNTASDPLISHYIYAIVGDGDLMEGISYEAASLAGHMGLGNIIYIYDSNDISIEGSTDLAFSDDITKRFESCHWHVQRIDGHDIEAIERAVLEAQRVADKPSMIIARTRIAKGSPAKEGSEAAHGAPLGKDEVRATKKNLGCDPEAVFCVQDSVYSLFGRRVADLKKEYSAWQDMFKKTVTGEKLNLWNRHFGAPDMDSLSKKLPDFADTKKIATRSASGKVMEVLFRELPNFIGGSADLSPSTKTFV